MSGNQVEVSRDGPVGIVVLNRPQARNAQSRILLEQMDRAFTELVDDDAIRIILLTGKGEHFSAGHDLGTPEERSDQQERPIEPGIRGRFQRSRSLYVDFSLRWRNLHKPTIAVVQGYCIFGGWMIASAMDLVFAAEDAMFLATNFQYFSIPWDIPPRKVKEMLYESRFVNGVEAMELGFVNRTYPKERLLEESLRYAHRVAANDPFQLRMIKLAVNQAQDAQGFTSHISAAHTMHMLSSVGEGDPGYALSQQRQSGVRRRPMVQRALENYEQHQKDK